MKRLVVLAMWSLFASSAVLSQRLPANVVPDSYDLKFEPDLASATFAGDETIHVHLQKATTAIVLNSAEIEFKEVWIGSADFKQAAAGPIAADLGATLVPGEADEKRALRARVFGTLAMYSRDPQSIERSRALAEQYMKDPNSVYAGLASSALYASALEGNAGLYERYLEHMKTAKTPEEYYNYFGALTQFPSVELAKRTYELLLSPDVKNQDLYQIGGLLGNTETQTAPGSSSRATIPPSPRKPMHRSPADSQVSRVTSVTKS
jgi:aminopeptidase N